MTIFRSLARLLLGVSAAAGGLPLASAAPQDRAQVPAEWITYAESVTHAVSSFLGDDSEASIRFRAYIDTTRPAPDRPTAELMLKLRIASDGKIASVDFPPFAHAEANADMRSALVGRQIDRPPAAMPQPLRLTIQLEPVPPGGPTAL